MIEWVCIVCDREVFEQLHWQKAFVEGNVSFYVNGEPEYRECFLFPLSQPLKLSKELKEYIELVNKVVDERDRIKEGATG